MSKHRCRIKFKQGKIECASEFCADCADKKNCEELTIDIEDKFEGIESCMAHDSHKREKGKMRQKRWAE